MNIHDVEKRATPGPWFSIHGKGTCFHDGNNDSVQHISGYDGDEEQVATIAEFWPTIPRSQAKADADLVAHCRNNYLRALGECQRLLVMLVEQRKDGGWPTDDLAYDRKLIAELAEVKG